MKLLVERWSKKDMIYITLRADKDVREQLTRFERIVSSYGVRVVECREKEREKTIELAVSAYAPTFVRSVNAAALDCFGEAFLASR